MFSHCYSTFCRVALGLSLNLIFFLPLVCQCTLSCLICLHSSLVPSQLPVWISLPYTRTVLISIRPLDWSIHWSLLGSPVDMKAVTSHLNATINTQAVPQTVALNNMKVFCIYLCISLRLCREGGHLCSFCIALCPYVASLPLSSYLLSSLPLPTTFVIIFYLLSGSRAIALPSQPLFPYIGKCIPAVHGIHGFDGLEHRHPLVMAAQALLCTLHWCSLCLVCFSFIDFYEFES